MTTHSSQLSLADVFIIFLYPFFLFSIAYSVTMTKNIFIFQFAGNTLQYQQKRGELTI